MGRGSKVSAAAAITSSASFADESFSRSGLSSAVLFVFFYLFVILDFYLLFDLFHYLGVVLQIFLCIVTSLSYLCAVIGEPCAALLNDIEVYRKVNDLACS